MKCESTARRAAEIRAYAIAIQGSSFPVDADAVRNMAYAWSFSRDINVGERRTWVLKHRVTGEWVGMLFETEEQS